SGAWIPAWITIDLGIVNPRIPIRSLPAPPVMIRFGGVGFVGGEDGLAAALVTHFQGLQPGAMIVHQADQPVIALMTDLAPRKPFREEVAAVSGCQRLGLVHLHLP